MPTVPTKALFDKDIRSPFPLHVTAVPPLAAQPPPSSRTTPQEPNERINTARTDFSQIKRPTPVKAKASVSVFDVQLPHSDVPHSLRHLSFNVLFVFVCRKANVQKPGPPKSWGSVESLLDRMVNASPMPKVSSSS
jgi:hypothetical protein